VAVARYQRDHGGELPATLGDLLPAYMSAVPIDPYSGRSLQYRQASGAYAIYSIGYDGTDDGGANLLETYRGTVLRPQPGSDIGVRVLIGEQTRRSGN
jgi:hypothetical protein